MDLPPATRDQIAADAADWFVRLHETNVKPSVHEAFSEWILRSPVHVQTYLEVSELWADCSVPQTEEFTQESLLSAVMAESSTANVVQLNQETGERPAVPSRPETSFDSQGVWIGFAATALLVLSGLFGYVYLQRASDFSTAIGEQRSVTLADGSVVYLNTDSAVRLRWRKGERRIELIKGEARFRVAKDVTRPFLVSANSANVRALGTEFNVRADGTVTDIAVLQGRIQLTASSSRPTTRSSLELAAGERARVSEGGIQTGSGPSIERVEAWTGRQLVFNSEPLYRVIAEFNRYRVDRLVLDAPQLAELRVTGKFDASDPEAVIAQLTTVASIVMGRTLDGRIHITTKHPRRSEEN